MSRPFSVTLDWKGKYAFSVDFAQDGVPPLRTDESPPLGDGEGPSPASLLAAAVGNCMAASFRYCLDRAGVELLGLQTTVEGTIVRNERGRLRIGELRVRLEPRVDPANCEGLDRCIETFEDFCIVGESVRKGIDVEVEVAARGQVVASVGPTDSDEPLMS